MCREISHFGSKCPQMIFNFSANAGNIACVCTVLIFTSLCYNLPLHDAEMAGKTAQVGIYAFVF